MTDNKFVRDSRDALEEYEAIVEREGFTIGHHADVWRWQLRRRRGRHHLRVRLRLFGGERRLLRSGTQRVLLRRCVRGVRRLLPRRVQPVRRVR